MELAIRELIDSAHVMVSQLIASQVQDRVTATLSSSGLSSKMKLFDLLLHAISRLLVSKETNYLLRNPLLSIGNFFLQKAEDFVQTWTVSINYFFGIRSLSFTLQHYTYNLI